MSDREQQWRKALDEAKAKLDEMGLDFVDGHSDVGELRQQLIRTRLAAAAERQAHESRAVVLDVEDLPGDKGLRFTVCVPTGDRAELREAMASALAAMRISSHDVAAMVADAERAKRVLDALDDVELDHTSDCPLYCRPERDAECDCGMRVLAPEAIEARRSQAKQAAERREK